MVPSISKIKAATFVPVVGCVTAFFSDVESFLSEKIVNPVRNDVRLKVLTCLERQNMAPIYILTTFYRSQYLNTA